MRKAPIFPGPLVDAAAKLDVQPLEDESLSETPELEEAPKAVALTPQQIFARQQEVIEARFREFVTIVGAELGQPLGAMLVFQTQQGNVLGAVSIAQCPQKLQLKIVDAIVNKLHEISRSLKVRINSISRS